MCSNVTVQKFLIITLYYLSLWAKPCNIRFINKFCLQLYAVNNRRQFLIDRLLDRKWPRSWVDRSGAESFQKQKELESHGVFTNKVVFSLFFSSFIFYWCVFWSEYLFHEDCKCLRWIITILLIVFCFRKEWEKKNLNANISAVKGVDLYEKSIRLLRLLN